MSLGWQVILAFLIGIFVTVVLFIIAFKTTRWVIASMSKGITNAAKQEAAKVKKEIKEHFGVRDREE